MGRSHVGEFFARGPVGRAVLLRLVNVSWVTAAVPAAWRTAEIAALLKQGKDPHTANGGEKTYRF